MKEEIHWMPCCFAMLQLLVAPLKWNSRTNKVVLSMCLSFFCQVSLLSMNALLVVASDVRCRNLEGGFVDSVDDDDIWTLLTAALTIAN